jgi:hypothetical protein
MLMWRQPPRLSAERSEAKETKLPGNLGNLGGNLGTSMISKSQEETEVSFHLEESCFEA